MSRGLGGTGGGEPGTVCHCVTPSHDQSYLVLSEGEGGGWKARTELPAAQELCVGTTIKTADYNKSELCLYGLEREKGVGANVLAEAWRSWFTVARNHDGEHSRGVTIAPLFHSSGEGPFWLMWEYFVVTQANLSDNVMTNSVSKWEGTSSMWLGVYYYYESESLSVMSDSLQPHGLYSPWIFPGQNTRVGSLSLLQGIFPIQRSNPGLPHCRQILYQLSHKGRPRILEWVAYSFSSGSSWLRNWTGVSCIAGRLFTNWAMREARYFYYKCE